MKSLLKFHYRHLTFEFFYGNAIHMIDWYTRTKYDLKILSEFEHPFEFVVLEKLPPTYPTQEDYL